MNVRIGFDLDGVLINNTDYNGHFEEYLKRLGKPVIKLDINRIIQNGKHDVYIITGRSADTLAVTRQTVKNLFPGFDLSNLIMANPFTNSEIDARFRNPCEYRRYIAHCKSHWLKKLKISYYIEDNPLIIRLLKEWQATYEYNYCVIDVSQVLFVDELMNSFGR